MLLHVKASFVAIHYMDSFYYFWELDISIASKAMSMRLQGIFTPFPSIWEFQFAGKDNRTTRKKLKLSEIVFRITIVTVSLIFNKT